MDDHLCECGCGERTAIATKTDAAQGRRKGQPNRFVAGHNARRGPVDYVVDEKGCWVWQRFINPGGYGMIGRGMKGRVVVAHRWYFERKHGPIPDGLELDHLCRNRACCNPDHVEPVTRTVNTHRGAVMKITAEDVVAIDRAFADSGLPLRTFAEANAERWGISASHLRKVIRRTGGLWSSVPKVA